MVSRNSGMDWNASRKEDGKMILQETKQEILAKWTDWIEYNESEVPRDAYNALIEIMDRFTVIPPTCPDCGAERAWEFYDICLECEWTEG